MPSPVPLYVVLSNTSASLAIAVSIFDLCNVPVVSVAKSIGSVVKSRTATELSATCVQAELEAI